MDVEISKGGHDTPWDQMSLIWDQLVFYQGFPVGHSACDMRKCNGASEECILHTHSTTHDDTGVILASGR